MKRTVVAIAFAVALSGCDKQSEAPFGLKWGQPVETISFIKEGDCQIKGNLTTCMFENKPPFNEWSNTNLLEFRDNKLNSIKNIFSTSNDRDSFCDVVIEEAQFIGQYANELNFNEFKDNCDAVDEGEEGAIVENYDIDNGKVSIHMTATPFVNVTTYTAN